MSLHASASRYVRAIPAQAFASYDFSLSDQAADKLSFCLLVSVLHQIPSKDGSTVPTVCNSVTHGKLCLEWAPFSNCCNSASPSCTSFPLKMVPLFLLSVTLQTVCLEWAPFCACCNSASPSYTSLPLKRDLLLPESGRKHYIQI